MQADNLNRGTNLVEHSLQLIRRMVNTCRVEEAVGCVVRKESVCRHFLAIVGTGIERTSLMAEDFLRSPPHWDLQEL